MSRKYDKLEAAREDRALRAARQAINSVADDPRVLQLFIAMVALLGSRTLKEVTS